MGHYFKIPYKKIPLQKVQPFKTHSFLTTLKPHLPIDLIKTII